MRKIIVKIKYAIWAFKKINKPHIGDVVVYESQKCFLIQGVSNPYWNLIPISNENLNKPKRDIFRRVHIGEFCLNKSFKRKMWAFKQSYKFRIDNWLLIDTYDKSIFSPISKL